MALLDRSEWYDLARDTNWTPSFVTQEELYPPALSGGEGIPDEAWEGYDEPYKVSFREYVEIQRQKDAGAYSVRAALERMQLYENGDPGWINTLKEHYGAIALVEYAAALMEARFVRFAKAPSMRNMATFGMLDELRHAQLQLYFPHEYIGKDRQFDWAVQALHTNNWGVIAARHFFDDTMMTRDVVSTSILLNFAFETGYTNLQFIGLAADAAKAGDYSFAKLIQSIQSDEARHAQIGTPLLRIMVENGKKEEAQKLIDIAFWRSWKLFAILTGLPMDYYMPLDQREGSFKEFMEEWIITQFLRALVDLGLEKPWYWDFFVSELDVHHHAQQLGTWSWRPTLWWSPAAGVSPDERDWLEEKYPGWNDSFGKVWDVITDNLLNGRPEKTVPGTLPILCNLSNLPIVGRPFGGFGDTTLTLDGRTYHFGSHVDKWVFEQDPARYKSHMTIVDRLLGGLIDPPSLEGVLNYMGIGVVSQGGDDAHQYEWVEHYRDQRKTA
jgi:toluene monooxygenase system protein A